MKSLHDQDLQVDEAEPKLGAESDTDVVYESPREENLQSHQGHRLLVERIEKLSRMEVLMMPDIRAETFLQILRPQNQHLNHQESTRNLGELAASCC